MCIDELWQLLKHLKRCSYNNPNYSKKRVKAVINELKQEDNKIPKFVKHFNLQFTNQPEVVVFRRKLSLEFRVPVYICIFTSVISIVVKGNSELSITSFYVSNENI